MRRLRTRVRQIRNDRGVGRRNSLLHRIDQELFKMVLAEITVHFVTNFLYPVIIIEIVATSYMNAEKSVLRLQIENPILIIARILSYTSHAASFYIYYIVSKTFRRQCKEIIYKYCCLTIRQPQMTNRPVIREEQNHI